MLKTQRDTNKKGVTYEQGYSLQHYLYNKTAFYTTTKIYQQDAG